MANCLRCHYPVGYGAVKFYRGGTKIPYFICQNCHRERGGGNRVSKPLDKSQYTEPEWILERIRRQKEVDDAENAHRIAENAVIGHRRMVPVAGGIVVTSFVLSIFGILGTLTFLIGGGVATLALLLVLARLSSVNEQAGKTKYKDSTLEALNNARHELLVWDQIDMADTADFKPREKPQETVKIVDGQMETAKIRDAQVKWVTAELDRIQELIASSESGPKAPSVSPPGMDPYTKYNSKMIQLQRGRGQGGSSEDGVNVRFRFNPGCKYHTNYYLFTCDGHAGHVRAYDRGELWQAMSEHYGCLIEFHMWAGGDPYVNIPHLRGEISTKKVYP